MYYSVIRASNLAMLARFTYDRLLATFKVNELLYREGLEIIIKSAYLKNKTYVETALSLIDQISRGKGKTFQSP